MKIFIFIDRQIISQFLIFLYSEKVGLKKLPTYNFMLMDYQSTRDGFGKTKDKAIF